MTRLFFLAILFLSGCSSDETDDHYNENAEFRVEEALYFTAHFPHGLGKFKELIDAPFYLSNNTILASKIDLHQYFDEFSKLIEEVDGNEKLKMTEKLSFKSFSPTYFLELHQEIPDRAKSFIKKYLKKKGAVVQVFYSENHLSYYLVKSNNHDVLSIVGELN